MKKLILVLVGAAVISVPYVKPASAVYTGSTNTEVEISFTHQVEFSSPGRSAAEIRDDAKKAIFYQLKHMHGPMSRSSIKAAPRGNDRISGIKISGNAGARSLFTAEYSFKGVIALQLGDFDTYSFPLPVNPYAIYSQSRVLNVSKPYPCTDPDYTSEGDFWYFWSPERPDCQLVEGREYTTVHAQLKRIETRADTLPDYERLIQDGQIKISVLIAPNHDKRSTRKNPLELDDEGAKVFTQLRDALRKGGFQESEYTSRELSEFIGGKLKKPFLRKFTKSTPRANLVIRVYYGSVSKSPKDFHHTFKHALENDSVVIYAGHSGLGGNLRLTSIEKENGFTIRPKLDQYQIYLFNGCSTYTYYNKQYFERKATAEDPQGTANLDILTNGLATVFSAVGNSTVTFIAAIDRWAMRGEKTSYRELAKKIDSRNLFGVNGDEDNPVVQSELSGLEMISKRIEVPAQLGPRPELPVDLKVLPLPIVEPITHEQMLRDVSELETEQAAEVADEALEIDENTLQSVRGE
jgi:hypothetical protein